MVDSFGMAMLDSSKNLQKHVLGLEIVSNVVAFLGDFGEEIALWTVFDHNVRALWAVHDLHQRCNIGMLAGSVVKYNLAVLELLLPWIQPKLVQYLDSISNSSAHLASLVNSPVCTNTKDSGQLDAICDDHSNPVLGLA